MNISPKERWEMFSSGEKQKKSCVPTGDHKYEIQHIWERHRSMMRLALLGYDHREIASLVGCTPQTVTNVMNSSIVKRELELMNAAANGEAVDVRAQLMRAAPKALLILEQIMDDETAPISLRAKVSMDNLSRNGFAPQINVRGDFSITHFTAEEIEKIKQDAISVGAKIVDAEFKELPALPVPSSTDNCNGNGNGRVEDE